jgi:hypothetical protein
MQGKRPGSTASTTTHALLTSPGERTVHLRIYHPTTPARRLARYVHHDRRAATIAELRIMARAAKLATIERKSGA